MGGGHSQEYSLDDCLDTIYYSHEPPSVTRIRVLGVFLPMLRQDKREDFHIVDVVFARRTQHE